ncbi:23451_t:CDS:2, partial [Gigaspora rosea]
KELGHRKFAENGDKKFAEPSDAAEKCEIGNYNGVGEKKNEADEIKVKRDKYEIVN